jgi:hypothetical protein
MQANRYVVFIDTEKMKKFRETGVYNFSGWVNKKIDEYLEGCEIK